MKRNQPFFWILPVLLAVSCYAMGVTYQIEPRLGNSVFVETVSLKKDGKARFILPRQALRDKSTVWIKNNGKLEMRKIRVAESDDITIIVDQGLKDKDEVIISSIAQPYSGMKVHSAKDEEKGKKEGMNK